MELIKIISLRLPVALWERLREQARQENRSLNGHIVHLLQKALGA